VKKNVVVTGASGGLGLALCRQLVSGGYRVIGTCRRHTDELSALEYEAPELGGEFVVRTLDLAHTESLQPFCRDVVRSFGGLYGLVNNAAAAHDGVLATMHETEIANVVHVNVLATILLTKHAIRPMLIERSGRVINVASIIASTGFNGLSVYGATKAALVGFTRSLAREVGRAGITVNALSPGYMQTEMTRGLQGDKLESIRRRSPLGRLVTPDDVAAAAAYLLSDAAAMVTGTELIVDAGSRA
jgi:3-oxoacyl-[acyl-carrier protein] reductase